LSARETQKKQSVREYGVSPPVNYLNKIHSFDLVHPVLGREDAKNEACRCLFCDDICNICVGACPNFANFTFSAAPENIPVYEIDFKSETPEITLLDHLEIKQFQQIINIGDFCNECGNCNTFCPTSGAPYNTKPKFYLSKKSFEQEDNCYLLFENELLFKKNNSLESLSQIEDYYFYKSGSLSVEIYKKDYSIKDIKPSNFSNEKLVLNHAAKMLFLLKNLKDLAIFK
jgi:putative selenate reductase